MSPDMAQKQNKTKQSTFKDTGGRWKLGHLISCLLLQKLYLELFPHFPSPEPLAAAHLPLDLNLGLVCMQTGNS